MRPFSLTRSWLSVCVALAALLVMTACSSGSGATPSLSASEATASPSAEASETEEPSESDTGTSELSLSAPDEVEAGAQFDVEWTGPNAQGDYVAVVPEGAEEWTFTDDYFNTNAGSPGTLTAPTKDGAYELWYVDGATEEVLLSVDITVLPFTGDLLAPDEVPAGTEFEVAWNGTGGQGDYVTIVPEGAEAWTSTDDYFDVSVGPIGLLYAPMKDGEYEIWYVSANREIQLRRPIVVLPLEITIDAPEEVAAGSTFQVSWTGPDGQGDYITINPVGAGVGEFLDWFYTNVGPTGEITAPDEPGEYEIWYATERVRGVFFRVPITVN